MSLRGIVAGPHSLFLLSVAPGHTRVGSGPSSLPIRALGVGSVFSGCPGFCVQVAQGLVILTRAPLPKPFQPNSFFHAECLLVLPSPCGAKDKSGETLLNKCCALVPAGSMLNKFRGEIHGSEGNVFISPSGVSRKKAENVMGLWLRL